MEREILTYPLSTEQLWDEFSFMIEYFTDKGFTECEILFGAAWGIYYYPSNEWNNESISLNSLATKVKSVEQQGLGKFGQDDLFVYFPHLNFRFCNDCDLHIYFTQHSPDIEFFYSRWGNLGYKPAEWLKNQTNGPGEKVRG
jgi:hypothetical protein